MATTWKNYVLGGWVALSFVSAFSTIYQNSKRVNQLEESDYIIKFKKDSTGDLYGFDDDKNGLVDRIEEVGIIPFKTGTPAFRIERIHLPADKDYDFYASRLRARGVLKELSD